MNKESSGVMWRQQFLRHANLGLSLQAQVRQMVVGVVLEGQWPTSMAIPSSREMAEILGLARNTVVIAYQNLVDEGYLIAYERRGYFANPALMQQIRHAPRQAHDIDPAQRPNWSQRFRFDPEAQRNITKKANWRHYPYPFIYGQFDSETFPSAAWRACCMATLSALEVSEWAQDMFLRDDEGLIKQLRLRVLPRRGVWVNDNELVITVGAQHALYLLADLLVGPDKTVGIEDPGYPDARNIFLSRTQQVQPLPIDDQGLIIDEDALARCDYVYVTPSHQSPTTVRMSLERKQALLRLAQKHDFIVIEDDYESENCLTNEASPSLKSLDQTGRVIYISSVSKVLAPGIRMGYVAADPILSQRLRAIRRLNIRHPTAYMQRVFAQFLSLGHYDAVLRKRAALLSEKADVLMRALDEHLPFLRYQYISGGAACWVECPPSMNSHDLAQAAEQQGVLIEVGDVFFTKSAENQHFFRLGFASISRQKIEPGIRQLASVIRMLYGFGETRHAKAI